jgi:hypothetical protein
MQTDWLPSDLPANEEYDAPRCGPSARNLIPAPRGRHKLASLLQKRISVKPAFVPGCACTRLL